MECTRGYPMRPGDQGFEESLVHAGGGLCQPAGPPENSYFDPSLLHNGQRVKTKGYCSDVFTDAAIRFITERRREPFLVYLPFNCPHGPFQIAEAYYKPYQELGMKPGDFPSVAGGHELKSIPDNTARVYGMVENIDDNLGRLFSKLDELGLKENTIVIFLTDNGPNGARYNAGMRAYKGSVYEGGIRLPQFRRNCAKLVPAYEYSGQTGPGELDPCGNRLVGFTKRVLTTDDGPLNTGDSASKRLDLQLVLCHERLGLGAVEDAFGGADGADATGPQ
ncbi:MAG: sulfatase-like hydrolase/transferase, partial [Planctomycetota bacterium]